MYGNFRCCFQTVDVAVLSDLPHVKAAFDECCIETPSEEFEKSLHCISPTICPSNMRIFPTWMTALKSLRSAVASNLDHYASRTSAQQGGANRFHQCFTQLEEHTAAIQPAIDLLNLNAHKYDFENVPANGENLA